MQHTHTQYNVLSQRDEGKKIPSRKSKNSQCCKNTHVHVQNNTRSFTNTGKKTWGGKHVHTTHTHKVHYNEAVDVRPLCRDPNSCSALGADHEQGQGEPGGKQSQSPKTHTHTHAITHITHTFSQTFTHHIMQMLGHTHWAQCGKSVVMDLRGFSVEEQDHI